MTCLIIPGKKSMTLKFLNFVQPFFLGCWSFQGLFSLTWRCPAWHGWRAWLLLLANSSSNMFANLGSFAARCALAEFHGFLRKLATNWSVVHRCLHCLNLSFDIGSFCCCCLRNPKNKCKISVKHLHLQHYIHIGQMPMARSIFSRLCDMHQLVVGIFMWWDYFLGELDKNIWFQYVLFLGGIVISINQHLQCVNIDAQHTSSVHIGWNKTLNQILLWSVARLSYSQNVHEIFKRTLSVYLIVATRMGPPK